MKNNEYNEAFSKIYDERGQIAFSLTLFEKVMKYFDENSVKVKKHLDFACGTGAFCFKMYDSGVKTKGVDISEEMIKIAEKNKVDRNILFFQGNMTNYISDEKYDFVTCNYDAINHLLSFNEWEMFFNNCYQNLSENGYLLFDFNTFKKFNTFDGLNYDIKNKGYDVLSMFAPINDHQVVFRLNYYILENNGYYSKVSQSVIESFFDNNEVVEALKKANFKNINLFDQSFNQCTIESETDRIYVLCQK